MYGSLLLRSERASRSRYRAEACCDDASQGEYAGWSMFPPQEIEFGASGIRGLRARTGRETSIGWEWECPRMCMRIQRIQSRKATSREILIGCQGNVSTYVDTSLTSGNMYGTGGKEEVVPFLPRFQVVHFSRTVSPAQAFERISPIASAEISAPGIAWNSPSSLAPERER